jgi:glycosyltransferase involved in cell wall biosynthesis
MGLKSMASKHLVIDLTPLLPGGDNGGAKLVILKLLKGLKESWINDDPGSITLLTAPWNESELASYTSANLTCKTLKHLSQDRLSIRTIWRKISYKVSQVLQLVGFPSLLTQLKTDLLFCPFSNPSFSKIDIPCVSILYDLQHWQYPDFFSPQEIKHRNHYLKKMVERSEMIVCISHFSERSLHDYCHHHHLFPKATSVIYPYFKPSKPLRFNSQADHIQRSLKLLDQTQLKAIPYLLYPANYWPHKNHQQLLHAYAEYLQWYRQSSPEDPCFHLVFTGTLTTAEQAIKTLAETLKLTDYVHFLGYLEDRAFETIWHHCQGLIFPSLYEGFGLPIVEAMERSKPILCSQIPALEEVTQGACLYFNPAELESIVTALRSFTLNPQLRETLKQQSHDRYHYFQNLKPIDDYISLFQQMLNRS